MARCNESKINFVRSIPPKDKRCPNHLYFLNEGGKITPYITDGSKNIYPYGGDGVASSDVTIISPNNTISVGRLGQDFNIDVNKILAEDVNFDSTNIDERIRYILSLLVEHPTYYEPTVSTTNITETVERGSDISLLYKTIFTKNDAGDAYEYEIERRVNNQNWGILGYDADTTINETNIKDAIEYRSKVYYHEGLCKDNNMGEKDCTGRIEQGHITSGTRTITPKLRFFYGEVGDIPTNSDHVRALNQSSFEGAGEITLNTTPSGRIWALAIPENYDLQEVLDGNFAWAKDTESFTHKSKAEGGPYPKIISVRDANSGNTPHNYKLYVKKNAKGYGGNSEFKMTITKEISNL